MIGLVMMIRARVRSEWGFQDDWDPKPRACLASNHSWAYPVSRRYYELLDSCTPPQPEKPV